MDEPNVNRNVLNILDDKLESENFPKALNIGSCAQHTVHGAFKDGFLKTWKIDNLLKSVFWLLNDSAARQNVYLAADGKYFPIEVSRTWLGLCACFWFNVDYCLRFMVILLFICMFFFFSIIHDRIFPVNNSKSAFVINFNLWRFRFS